MVIFIVDMMVLLQQFLLQLLGHHNFTEDGVTIPHFGITLMDTAESIFLEQPFSVNAGDIVAMELTSDKTCRVTAGFYGWLENV